MKTVVTWTFRIVVLWHATVALAQFPNDKFRDVTPAGPYPIYIAAQGVWGKGHDDFAFLSRQFNPSDPKRHLWGFEGTGGFVMNERKILNIYLETSFRQLSRSQRNDRSQTLTYIHQTVSGRVGLRVNFPFYPVTFHLLGGPILHSQQVIRLDRDTLNGVSSRRLTALDKISFRNGLHIPGWDLKLRFNLIDAISSSGGLGLYIEAYYAHLNKPRIPVERFVSGTNVQQQPDYDPWNHSYSVGMVIPLALRVKRIFPEPCDWCKQNRKEIRKARRLTRSQNIP